MLSVCVKEQTDERLHANLHFWSRRDVLWYVLMMTLMMMMVMMPAIVSGQVEYIFCTLQLYHYCCSNCTFLWFY